MSGQFKELKRNPTRNTIVPIEIKISGSRPFIFCRLFVFARLSNYSRLRDSAWRRRAFGNVLFKPTPNFLKILNFQFTRNRQLSSKVMLWFRDFFILEK